MDEPNPRSLSTSPDIACRLRWCLIRGAYCSSTPQFQISVWMTQLPVWFLCLFPSSMSRTKMESTQKYAVLRWGARDESTKGIYLNDKPKRQRRTTIPGVGRTREKLPAWRQVFLQKSWRTWNCSSNIRRIVMHVGGLTGQCSMAHAVILLSFLAVSPAAASFRFSTLFKIAATTSDNSLCRPEQVSQCYVAPILGPHPQSRANRI